jgi:peptidoglycan/LPS O-acetylase OafA/YrhL
MNNRFRTLDCLRFLAAIGVILFHVNGKPGSWVSSLYLCVDLFFILSGFVLEPSFPKRKNSRDFIDFIIRRYIRLAPMLYSTLVFSVLYEFTIVLKNSFEGGVSRPSLNLTLTSIVFSVLFLQIFSNQAILLNYPMWSLSAEWIVNLLLVFPLSGNSRKRNAIAIYFVGLLIQISNMLFTLPEFLVQLSRCLTGIILGVLLRKFFELTSVPFSLKLFSLLLIVFLVSISFVSHLNQKLAPLLCTIPFSVLIFALAKFESARTTGISGRFAYWSASLSFGVYAWHVPLAGLVERYSPAGVQSDTVLRFLALSTTSCLFGFLASKYFERPIQRHLQKFIGIKLGWARERG